MDLKEVNQILFPNNVRFLVNKKPYYFNVMNIPYDDSIHTIEILYDMKKVLDISVSWNHSLIINHLNYNKIALPVSDEFEEFAQVPTEFFKSYMTLQHFLNIVSAPNFPALMKQLLEIKDKTDIKLYQNNWETEQMLASP